MNKRLTKTVAIVFTIVLILILNVVTILSMIHHKENCVRADLNLRKHISVLKYELTIGHLWLEELLKGNCKIDVEKDIIIHFENAKSNSTNFLKNIEIDESSVDYEIYADFNKIDSVISNLYNIVLERLFTEYTEDLTKRKGYDGNDSLDIKFDTNFNDVVNTLNHADSTLDKHLNKGYEQRNKDFYMDLTFIIIVNCLIILLIYIMYRSNKKYEIFITNQKHAFEKLFQKSSDGLLLIDNERIIDCNESVMKMLGTKNKEDVINKHPADLSPYVQQDGRDSLVKAEEMMQICINSGTHNFEWLNKRFDGENFWVEVVLTSLVFNKSNIIHVAWRDISKRKALEKSLSDKTELYKKLNLELDQKVQQQSAYLLQQSRLAQMGEMISMIAHQWRQPLASISAIAGTMSISLIVDEFDKKNQLEQLNSITDITNHLSSTIDVFRTFFQDKKQNESINIKDVVYNCLEIVGPILKTRNIKVNCHFDEDQKINISPIELKQVVLNLIKNSEDILLDKGIKNSEIWIDSYVKGSNIYLCIEDNAGGVPEDIVYKIFDPYFTTKSTKGGTGLGLYMSKIIIEEHLNGKLNTKNTKTGAIFTIVLPIQGRKTINKEEQQ